LQGRGGLAVHVVGAEEREEQVGLAAHVGLSPLLDVEHGEVHGGEGRLVGEPFALEAVARGEERALGLAGAGGELALQPAQAAEVPAVPRPLVEPARAAEQLTAWRDATAQWPLVRDVLALDAFTREELWCTLRDLHAAQKFNVILVTHDLRESVFLADTVYCMSRSPGRFVVKRHIDLPKPRDLEVTYTSQFTEIVHELRGHIGAMRGKPGVAVPQ